MKCHRCGNEIQRGEVFCGQCGTAISLPAAPTQMISAPSSSLRSGRLPSLSASGASALLPPHSAYAHPQAPSAPAQAQSDDPAAYANQRAPGAGYISSGQSSVVGSSMLPGANHHSGFYHEATEEFPSSAPGTVQSRPVEQAPHSVFSQTRQASQPAVTRYNNLAPRQPAGAPYGPANTMYGGYPAQPGPGASIPGYEYGMSLKAALPPQKQQNGAAVILISICLAVVLIAVVGVATYALRVPAAPKVVLPASVPTQSVMALPTPTLVPIPTPTPGSTPTAVATQTPLADTGFLWCGPPCTSYGFAVEYPGIWQASTVSAGTGIQFVNPVQPDELAIFSAPGPTSGSATDILNTQLQTAFVMKPGYSAPASTGTSNLSGETWITALIYYQNETTQQRERVELFTTVYQGKGYSIELQAPDAQFDGVNATYYAIMLGSGKFQFVQPGTP